MLIKIQPKPNTTLGLSARALHDLVGAMKAGARAIESALESISRLSPKGSKFQGFRRKWWSFFEVADRQPVLLQNHE